MNGWLIVLASIAYLVALLRALFFLVDVDGHSMVPALENGDRVLVLRLWRTGWLRKGQIVVTHYVATPWNPGQHPMAAQQDRYIKRITGVAGETIVTQLSDLPEPLQESRRSQHDEEGRRVWQIPPGYCFVKGDSYGLDSTLIGPIPVHAIQGIVLAKLRPRRGTRRWGSAPEIETPLTEWEEASCAFGDPGSHRSPEKP